MDLSIILTYRCNSKCSMCSIWQFPTNPDYEVNINVLEKLPSGFDYINLTGGEPTLRDDLPEICDVLFPKTKKLEISTNGLHGEKLLPIVKKYPDIKIRISLEAIGNANDVIRGEKNGYTKKIEAMNSLISAGGCDLGFATTFQDENIDEVLKIYQLTKELKIEMATSALHNAFQFHKNDNSIYDRLRVAKNIEKLIEELLDSNSLKSWFRAYLNLGLIRKVLGQPRLYPCTQGSDNVFIDPWSDVYACNVRNDLYMGNLKEKSWEEIYFGELATEVRKKVAQCTQNCWMVSSAKTAMRTRFNAKLPKPGVLWWVIINKIKRVFGFKINFEKYIDYSNVVTDEKIYMRESYLEKVVKKTIQPQISQHYNQFGKFFNK
jgi:Fe-coproporphyrin III synthase